MKTLDLLARAFPGALLLMLAGAPQAQGLQRFVNGDVADADEINANFDFLLGEIEQRDQQISALETRLAALEQTFSADNQALLAQLLPRISMEELDQLDGSKAATVRFSGVNLQLVSGTDSTDSVNGTGNLILGYAETESPDGGVTGGSRTGSHNLVLGRGNAYTGFGGIVAGSTNTIAGNGSSVLGGRINTARGTDNVIVAGQGGLSDGARCAILSGDNNKTGVNNPGVTIASAVVGGYSNTVDEGSVCVVVGGGSNTTGNGVVVGGNNNVAGSFDSVVVGGHSNITTGSQAVIVGGSTNSSSSPFGVVVGGQNNLVSGNFATIVAGKFNLADGEAAVVVGGGGSSQQFNRAGGDLSVVVGGRDNDAFGFSSVISGGFNRDIGASGTDDWRGGNLFSDF